MVDSFTSVTSTPIMKTSIMPQGRVWRMPRTMASNPGGIFRCAIGTSR
jgi:hypothetical protein